MNKRTLARLKRRLRKRGYTQEQVAQAAGVTRTMVNHVINGRARSQRVLDVMELMERGL